MAKTDYTFETFMTTDSNRLARLAAEEICRFPGKTYNPLYFHGAPGAGKTHLLCAIANSFLEKGAKVLCVSAGEFAKEFVEAIKNREVKEFKTKYHSVNVLLMDNFQYMVGKTATQEELLNILDGLMRQETQIVIAADSSPGEMPKLSDTLRDKLFQGLCVELNTPDLESRMFLVEQALINQGICWPKEACRYVALKSGTSINQIEGEINVILSCKTVP